MKIQSVQRFWLSIAILLLLPACSSPPAEQEIRNNIDAIQQAIEKKNRGAVLEQLSEFFVLNDKVDKKSLGGMLMVQFMRHKNISVTLADVDVAVDETDPRSAFSTLTAVLLGAENIIPDSGRVYRLSGEWQLEGSQWHLMTLSWK